MCSIFFLIDIITLHHCRVSSLFLVLEACSVEASGLSAVFHFHSWGELGFENVIVDTRSEIVLRCFVWIRWRRSCVAVDSCTAGSSGPSSTSRCTGGSPPPASGARLLCNTVTAPNLYGFNSTVCIVSHIHICAVRDVGFHWFTAVLNYTLSGTCMQP